MKVSQKISDAEVAKALKFLANNWKNDPKLRGAISSIFEKLKSGNTEDQENFLILDEYLSYPGSDGALNVSTSLHAAARIKEGRRAAGLPPSTKRSNYSAKLVKFNDKVLETMIKFELGKATKFDVERDAIAYLGVNRDKKTIKKFIEELRPRAKEGAVFFAALEKAVKTKQSL